MSALLRIYDDVTSNKYVSLSITVASTAFMARRVVYFLGHSYVKEVISSQIIIANICTGVAFALLANIFLKHNKLVKNEGELNSIYATFSLFIISASLRGLNEELERGFWETASLVPTNMKFMLVDFSFFKLSFLATNFVLQLLEKLNKIDC